MRNSPFHGCGSTLSDISSLFRAPQQSGRHSFANPLAVCLFVNDSQIFGVNTQEQLSEALARDPRLNIDNDAVISHFTVGFMVQFAVSPQPKYRSTMRHFLLNPLPGELAKNAVNRFKYFGHRDASIHSYEHYRSNVLAERSLCVGGILEFVERASGVFHG